jgi:hypothetical protein
MKLGFPQWLSELQAEAAKYDYPIDDVEAFRTCYYEEGFTPVDALLEDMSNALP